MECRRTDTIRGILLAVAALLITATVVILSVGTTFGRYQTTLYGVGRATVLSKQMAAVTVTPNHNQEWFVGGESSYLEFSVSNEAAGEISKRDRAVLVRLFVPEAIAAQPNLRVILTWNGRSYEATAIPLHKGTQIYAEMGAGSVYCFTDSFGNELFCSLPGETRTQLDMTITVVGGTDPTGFRLYTETVQTP